MQGGELLQKILDKKRFSEEETRRALIVVLVRSAFDLLPLLSSRPTSDVAELTRELSPLP